MKILIAEDQAPAALFLRRTLERMGHEPIVVSDGEAAWKAMQEQTIPLVISDWVMPRMDGLELCRQVRARTSAEGRPYTYVILLTSKDSRQDKLDGLRAGADDFLTKPPDPDELAVRLEIAARILKVHHDLHRRNAQLAELATIDELTGAKNRRRFREDLGMLFALATRQGTSLSVVMLDVDHFKQYNDEFGHPAGDDVLRTIVRTLREGTREQDVVARYGGEEFVVLLPATSAEASIILAERLRSKIEAIPWPKRQVTASLGVATTGPDIPNSSALVEAADQALYRSKRAGRNRVTSYQLPLEDASAVDESSPVPLHWD
jgi:two-component system cell cycle response regulator